MELEQITCLTSEQLSDAVAKHVLGWIPVRTKNKEGLYVDAWKVDYHGITMTFYRDKFRPHEDNSWVTYIITALIMKTSDVKMSILDPKNPEEKAFYHGGGIYNVDPLIKIECSGVSHQGPMFRTVCEFALYLEANKQPLASMEPHLIVETPGEFSSFGTRLY